jgi:hypothetical protein
MVDVVVGWTVVVSMKVLEVMGPLLRIVSTTDWRTVSSLTYALLTQVRSWLSTYGDACSL